MLDSKKQAIKLISDSISEAARYEQMAEECVELAQACLKKARKLRGENKTPKTMAEIDINIEEEFSDINLCAKTLGIVSNDKIERVKLQRWIERQKLEGSLYV